MNKLPLRSLLTCLIALCFSTSALASPQMQRIIKHLQSSEKLDISQLTSVVEKSQFKSDRNLLLQAAWLKCTKEKQETLRDDLEIDFASFNFGEVKKLSNDTHALAQVLQLLKLSLAQRDFHENAVALDELSEGVLKGAEKVAIVDNAALRPVKLGGSLDKETLDLYTTLQTQVRAIDAAIPDSVLDLAQSSLKINDSKLRKATVRCSLLGMLAGKHPFLNQFKSTISQRFPTENHLGFLSSTTFMKDCSKCAGVGQVMIKCKKCKDGSCPNGTCQDGQIAYRGLGGKYIRKPCPTCKGSNQCGKCNGRAEVASKCRTCKTKGSLFSTDASPALLVESKVALDKMLSSLIEGKQADDFITSVDKAKDFTRKELKLPELETGPKLDPTLVADSGEAKAPETETITIDPKELEDPENTPQYLKLAVEELQDYINAQERRSGLKIASKVYGRPVDNQTYLYLIATPDFLANDKGVQKNILTGLHAFWKVRVGSNGVGQQDKTAVILLNPAKVKIGSTEGGTTRLD